MSPAATRSARRPPSARRCCSARPTSGRSSPTLASSRPTPPCTSRHSRSRARCSSPSPSRSSAPRRSYYSPAWPRSCWRRSRSPPMRTCAGYEEAMLFVVLLHYTKPLDAVDAVRADHLRHLETHAARGVFHAWARRAPAAGGVLLATAPDRAALEAVVANDPYITAGVARAEILGFKPSNVLGALKQYRLTPRRVATYQAHP